MRASASWCSGSATRRRTWRSRPRETQTGPSSPCGGAHGSCPSTSGQGPPMSWRRTCSVAAAALRCSASSWAAVLKTATGTPMDYGLPKPDHKLAQAHPTVSSDLLPRLGHGDIEVKPNIARFAGDAPWRSWTAQSEELDLIVYCTGYKITFPFFDPDVVDATDNRIALYRRVVHPDIDGLFFVGLLQPLGAIMPLAEAQSEWIADLLEGKAKLPAPERMWEVIKREDARMAQALRRLETPHDPGRLPPLHARDQARAKWRAARALAGHTGARAPGLLRRVGTTVAARDKRSDSCPLCGGAVYPWIGVPQAVSEASVGLPSPVDPDEPTGGGARLVDRCQGCGAGIERAPGAGRPLGGARPDRDRRA